MGRIVVGTHSFEIDRQLLMLLSTNGWELEGIDVCEMREDGQLPVTLRDGTQVWRNRRFDSGRGAAPHRRGELRLPGRTLPASSALVDVAS